MLGLKSESNFHSRKKLFTKLNICTVKLALLVQLEIELNDWSS